ncbi:MAG: hypothetical protein WCF26_15310 [Candidatus Sulfotelmatobacter sp.]
MRLVFVLPVLAAMLISARALAQDDPNEIPLGDVARNLRRKTPPALPVIDDDNLPEAMQQAESRQGFGSSLRFLMTGEGKGFQVSAPDVTCSLSFTANVKSLLSSQYAQMELPAAEVAKLEGQATIEGDALTVPVLNATDWHVSELAIALTVVRKLGRASLAGESLNGTQGDATTAGAATDAKLPVANDLFLEVRPEKKPDVTVIYRIRAAAAPGERTVFSAPLALDVAATDEWHWAIVQAKGYPPQNYSGAGAQTAARAPAALVPTSLSTIPQTVPAISPLPNPQP